MALEAPRILTVRQPFATLIVKGRKDVENRSRDTPYRGPVLIHAAKLPGPSLERRYFEEELDAEWLDIIEGLPNPFPRSAVVGVVTLEDVVAGQDGDYDSPYFHGPYGWILTNATELRRPIPCLGRLGLCAADPALVKAVEKQIGSLRRFYPKVR